ncbi:MAG: DUF1491 family protein [Candidatus Puniceispirillaceae bacterium]
MGKLKSQLLVNAAMRLADQNIIPFYVLKKGDPDSGIIFIEIEESHSHSRLFTRALNFDGIYEYRAISGDEALPREQVSEMIEREISRDEDCWVIATSGEKGLQLFTQMT